MSLPPSLDLDAIRTRLAATRGRTYWRSLEEVADAPAFRDALARQFPSQTAAWIDPLRRRDFLRLMAASLALGGLTGCTSSPPEAIVPYVRRPEDFVPGKPLFFATAMTAPGGFGLGVLVESHLGRPTKVEGNPLHPASLGATDASAQASVLALYDPDRAQTLSYATDIRPWTEFLAGLRAALGAQRAARGAGLRILTETVTSPTLANQLAAVLAAFPDARWHQYEAGGRDMARAGARLAFGEDIDTQYHLENCAVILALDADFLGCGPAHLRLVREWAARRRPGDEFNRLYAVESTLTPTGAKADHRLPLRARDVEGFARALAAGLGVPGVSAPADAAPADFLAAVTRDLRQQRGRSAVIPGDQQTPAVHALAHAINQALGSVGRTVVHTGPIEARPEDQAASLRALVADMDAGAVELLIVLGGNPVYTAPADIPFAASLERVPLRVRLGLYYDETSERCHWHVPEAHYLEAWSDVRAFDGTVSIVQPLIAPLYGGRSAHEVLAAFGDAPEKSSYDLVRERWGSERRGAAFEQDWRRWLHDGVIPFTAARAKAVRVQDTIPPPAASAPGLEVVFRPDPAVHDGRFANNGWLQELPRPLTHVTWDNPVLIGPGTAQRLALATEDLVELRLDGRQVAAPVSVLPGHPDDSLTVYLGHGRRRAGRVGTGVGFDANLLRRADATIASGGELVRTGRRQPIPTTQPHHRMEGRDIVRAATLADILAPHGRREEHAASLYPPHHYDGYRWGMAIDLSTCVGCKACVVACQAENNIPVVGRDQVLRGRELHWLRIDTYHTGDPVAPETYFMPVPCMHCENAPCELVCPTEATVHSAEGLNDMVYNRCVGTRYCSNNCPYKVRRFNYFEYADWTTESLKPMRNPDVTVRSRGVMEKCTYCVQRLTHGRIEAEKEGRRVRDGEVVTACAQACPAEAIVFGDLNDPGSRVAKLRADARNYELLGELNTHPRTTYLTAVRNPDPDLG